MESVERLVDFTNNVADLFPEIPVHRSKFPQTPPLKLLDSV
jgi:hypothetical protein